MHISRQLRTVMLLFSTLSALLINAILSPDYGSALSTEETQYAQQDMPQISAPIIRQQTTTSSAADLSAETGKGESSYWAVGYEILEGGTSSPKTLNIRSLVATSDGGVIALASGGSYSERIDAVIRIDASGQVRWGRQIPRASLTRIIESADGFFAVGNSGTRGSFDLYSIDHMGTIRWQRKISRTYISTVRSLALRPNGNIIISGSLYKSNYPTLGDTGSWILELDSTATNVIWEDTTPLSRFGDKGVNSLLILPEDDIIFTASFSSGYYQKVLIGQVDSSGELGWVRIWPESGVNAVEPYGSSVLRLSNGDLLFAGHSDDREGAGERDLWFLRIDENGNPRDEFLIGGTEDDRLVAMRQSPNGNLIIWAITSSFYGWEDASWLLEVTTSGEIVWEKVFEDVQIRAMDLTPSGDLVLLGADDTIYRTNAQADIPDCTALSSSLSDAKTSDTMTDYSDISLQLTEPAMTIESASTSTSVPEVSPSSICGSPQTYSISGRVTMEDGTPLQGVRVSSTAFGKSAITDDQGHYTITDLEPGTYSVEATLTGHAFTPESHSVTVPPDVAGVNFVAEELAAPELGLQPYPDGFNFRNFKDCGTITEEDARYLFGDDAVCSYQIGNQCLEDPRASLWRIAAKASLCWIDGHCEGMSSTSLMLFLGLGPEQRNEPSDFNGARETYWISQSDVQSYLDINQIRQVYPPLNQVIEENLKLRPSEVLHAINSGIADGGTPVLVTVKSIKDGGVVGHSLVPYRVEDQGAGVFWVRVYDPNRRWPDFQGIDYPLVIDTSSETWSYLIWENETWSGDASSRGLGYQPITLYSNYAQCPWCSGSRTRALPIGLKMVIPAGPSPLVISDADGNRIGYVNGELINEIDGAIISPVLGGLGEGSQPNYYVPADGNYAIEIIPDPDRSTADQPNTFALLGPDQAVLLENVAPSSIQKTVVEVDDRSNSVKLNAGSRQEVTVSLTTSDESRSSLFRIANIDARRGDSVEVAYDDAEEHLIIDNSAASGGTYGISLESVSAEGKDFLDAGTVNIGPSDTHYIELDSWQEKNEVKLLVDEQSDGTIDEEYILSDEPTTVKLYLPSISSYRGSGSIQPTNTPRPTSTPTATATPSPTSTNSTPTPTATRTQSPTPTTTATSRPSATPTSTPTATRTPSPTATPSPTQAPDAPRIDVWYGDNQTFGALGHAQRWINILGAVSGPGPITSLTYSLNGGPDLPLNIGPDQRRLYDDGAFNVQLNRNWLPEGVNEVVLKASDGSGTTIRTVTVNHVVGNTWPLPYTIDWSSAGGILDVAQPVDGWWEIKNGELYNVTPGFDRLMAIGDDMAWTDYEVTVPVTVYSLNDSEWQAPSNGAGVGLFVRWDGHYEIGSEYEPPFLGWRDFGALAWYRWDPSGATAFELRGDRGVRLVSNDDRTIDLNKTYLFKIRIESPNQDGMPSTYRFKFWEEGKSEPDLWYMESEGEVGEPASGSMMLVAHQVEASFGDVTVTRVESDADPAWRPTGASAASGGGISNTATESSRPHLATAPDGTVYIAWSEEVNRNGEIYVLKWDGANWSDVGAGSAKAGGISNSTGDSVAPRLAVSSDGMLYAAWSEKGQADAEVYVKRWNGSSWSQLGGSASSGGISNTSTDSEWPDIAIAEDGTPFVAWQETMAPDSEIYVRYWSGASWEEFGANSASGGGISNNSGDSGNPSIALEGNRPSVAWTDAADGADYEVYLRRWSGIAWSEIGGNSATGGGISNNNGTSRGPVLAIDNFDNYYLAWPDDSNGTAYNIYVKYLSWGASQWVELDGSANGGGISESATNSIAPEIAIDASRVPYVTWYNPDPGEVYVRRRTNGSWEEVGTGSATGGGLSQNSGKSNHSAITIGTDAKPFVAWADDTSGNFEIYVKRWAK